MISAPFLASGDGGHAIPESAFGLLWRALGGESNNSFLWKFFGFNEGNHVGMHWFEAICFALLACSVLSLCAFFATRRYERIPRGMQNVMEAIVDGLRSIIHGFMGKDGEKYLPYLGTLFLFIFLMNLLGIIPGFRSPTMTFSTTLALGVTTFIVVQATAIRVNGFWGYLKHFFGDIAALAPLMFVVHLIGELAKPASLALRLRGNIYGEDKVMETLLEMGAGAWLPLHFPMMLFAIFTSLLQAYIFMALTCIYISSMTTHEGHEESHDHSENGTDRETHKNSLKEENS